MNTDDRDQQQDREDGLRELMQRGYAGAPEVDLERAAWREGRRRRTRRLVRGGVGGAGLVAAAAASAFALSGVLEPEATQAPPPAEQPRQESDPTQEPDPATELPSASGTPIGAGHAVVAPEGWLVVPMLDPLEAGSSAIVSCVVDLDQTGYLGAECPETAVRLETGLDAEPLEPFWSPDICYADPERTEVSVVTVSEEVQTGEAVVGGLPATWRRWTATCQDGRTFEPVQYWSAEAGVLASTVLRGQDLSSVLDGLVLDAGAAQLRGEVLSTGELGTTSVAGELLEWTGDERLVVETGSQVEYAITQDTVCLVEDDTQEAPPGMYLVPGSCEDLGERVATSMEDFSAPSLMSVVVDDTGAVVTIFRQYTP